MSAVATECMAELASDGLKDRPGYTFGRYVQFARISGRDMMNE